MHCALQDYTIIILFYCYYYYSCCCCCCYHYYYYHYYYYYYYYYNFHKPRYYPFSFYQIGSSHVVDATAEEEACSSARLLMAVTPSGNIAALLKHSDGSLHPDTVTHMMEVRRIHKFFKGTFLHFFIHQSVI